MSKFIIFGLTVLAFASSGVFAEEGKLNVDELLFANRESQTVHINSATGEIAFPKDLSDGDRKEILEMLKSQEKEKLPPLNYIKEMRLIDAQVETLENLKSIDKEVADVFARTSNKEALLRRKLVLKNKLKSFIESTPEYFKQSSAVSEQELKDLID